MSIQGCFQGSENVDFFGLFDGHAGRSVAEYCADHVHPVLIEKTKQGASLETALRECWTDVNAGLKVLHPISLSCDESRG